MVSLAVRFLPRIVPMMDNGKVVLAKYPLAHRLTRELGGLPRNIHVDRLLVDTEYRAQLKLEDVRAAELVFPLGIGELVVLRPPEGFQPNQSIHNHETGYTFPASAVPHEALNRLVHLLVRPAPEWDGTGTIIPASVSLLHDLPASGKPGFVDASNGFPCAVYDETLAGLRPEQIRFAVYRDGSGVVPVVRSNHYFGDDGRRTLILPDGPPGSVGVTYLVYDLLGRCNHEIVRGIGFSELHRFAETGTPGQLADAIKSLSGPEREALMAQAKNLLAA